MPTFGVTEELPTPDQPRRDSNLRKELPFPAKSLKILLEWVYTDEMPSELSKTEDVELVCQVWSLGSFLRFAHSSLICNECQSL